jgi:peptide chain release factor 2
MEIFELARTCNDRFKSIESILNIEKLNKRLEEINNEIGPNNWQNYSQQIVLLLKQQQQISNLLSKYYEYKEQIEFYNEFIQVESNFDDKDLISLNDKLSLFETQLLFTPIDDNPVILTINAGAGGLESANWVSMLQRMYMRWATTKQFIVEILDLKPSEEHSSICTDCVSLRFNGKYVYGLLKNEAGVHRLIRNSPFNSGDARHTSFAAVQVIPDIEDTIDIRINEKDLEITTMRGSGPGGQAVNKISSAVRMKHLPTGIIVNSRSERDQHANRRAAIKIMKAKLYDLEIKKRNDKKEDIFNQMNDVSFGHQIRTYTLSPNQLIKDHRINYECNKSDDFLDGKIDNCINKLLRDFK